jgi:peptidoglycan hydrolase-like protein with peptidoglycan-binding domain
MKLVLGSRGEDVTHLQVVLNFLGGSAIPLVEDGILGQKTHARLIARLVVANEERKDQRKRVW